MTLPFDGAISRFLAEEAPPALREIITNSSKREIITHDFPYERWLKRSEYEAHMKRLQLELVKLKGWVEQTGTRLVVIFEGRDTAGKSGAIKRVAENLNPRTARIMALPKPTDRERGQWFFQRYVAQLPTAGEIVLMDRSWYNRAVIEPVFGFCTAEENTRFHTQLPDFERVLTEDGLHLIKLWFNVSRAEQLRRMLDRERHPLKQWKLSSIDVQGLGKWDAYTRAIGHTLRETSFPHAPWTVIRADDKYRARIAAVQRILGAFDYADKDAKAIGTPDSAIIGDPRIWSEG
ncbi:MAG: polyphosphate kinase 2 [Pararhodobacter sp.]